MGGVEGVSAFPDGDNLFRWAATITGPSTSVYQGLSYKLILKFPQGYPYIPPVVTFESPCFHPNVDENGNICLDILKVIFLFSFSFLVFFLFFISFSFNKKKNKNNKIK